ncbi:MAG: hypothetical protein ACMXYC_02695 [Candidatus Woesearchaeota archaeon]
MYNKKGQVSLEFVVILSVLVLFLIAFFTVLSSMRSQVLFDAQVYHAQRVGHGLAHGLVLSELSGVAIDVFVPTRLDNVANYTLTAQNHSLLFVWDSVLLISLPTYVEYTVINESISVLGDFS